MHTRNRFLILALALVAVSLAALAAPPLMRRTQTTIDVPTGAAPVELSSLSYKANAFEAKISSVHLDVKGDAAADPVAAEWTFVGSNSDGQMHRVEITVRLLDAGGKQVGFYTKKFILGPGSHDQVCAVPMDIKAADWKAAKSAHIVTDWMS